MATVLALYYHNMLTYQNIRPPDNLCDLLKVFRYFDSHFDSLLIEQISISINRENEKK